MDPKIEPKNRMAQLLHLSAGNPASTLPTSTISNCFPGLEYDFKNFWRRAFVGIVMLEGDNYVSEVTDTNYAGLKSHRLLRVDDIDIVVPVFGPRIPEGRAVLLPSYENPGLVAIEWSNALAYAMQNQGKTVKCFFSIEEEELPVPLPADSNALLEVEMVVRVMFEDESGEFAHELLEPGELTQGLCSPWQHDYRECSCYYWPASRPDFVNVVPAENGRSRGDNWISRNRTGEYILDDRKDSRLVTYDELFQRWEEMLRFQVEGKDGEET
ncbi:hypothetical protein [Noviherbaspirillum suwonense]|uniref:RES domain-containing protein n=1 Tax=Noviherbaspirillum suwonense TaxID=1224511 RepID=A0ABY1PZW4_9BURK|nr:hypothetical protein [Noviherbaspirillum suwonense]SMP54420.1 hypothetical protein SAMN06295970_10410 [Noviherbaspirillum suwonense]